jgi:hypothetical protein
MLGSVIELCGSRRLMSCCYLLSVFEHATILQISSNFGQPESMAADGVPNGPQPARRPPSGDGKPKLPEANLQRLVRAFIQQPPLTPNGGERGEGRHRGEPMAAAGA